jgi:preprotein translocase subunit YajC
VLFAANGQGGGGYTLFIMLALLFGAMYFLMIRPQQKRRRQIMEMQSAIGVGDEIVTVGGLYGVVRELADDTVLLEVAPGVTNRYARAAIGQVIKPTAQPEISDDGPVGNPSAEKIIDSE